LPDLEALTLQKDERAVGFPDPIVGWGGFGEAASEREGGA
jgi:hypothetical protein